MAPLGILISSKHINLVTAASLINLLLMKRIICWIHDIFDMDSACIGHQTSPDCPFHSHVRQIRDRQCRHTPCSYHK